MQEEDIVDFEDFDYGDLDDINPDDLDIENLERELGLFNNEDQKEDQKASTDASDKKESEQKDANKFNEQDASNHAATSTDSKKAESMTEKSSVSSTNTSAASSTKPAPVKQSYQQRQQRPFNNNRSPYNNNNNNNNQMRGSSGFGGQYRPPNTSFPHQQYPFAHQGMMGMNMMISPHMNMQMPFPGMSPMMMGFNPQLQQRPPAGKIHINPKFAAMQQQKQQQQQQLLQLQHQQQQLQFQQQLQQQQGGFRPTPTGDVSQDEINRQRQQLLDMQRKRQSQKDSSTIATTNTSSKTTRLPAKDEAPKSKIQFQSTSPSLSHKRKSEEEGDQSGDERKRPLTIRGLANKGITIKGAAAAASTSTTKEPSRGASSPMQKRTGGILDRISSPKQQEPQQKSILDRISTSSSSSTPSSPVSYKTNPIMGHLNGGSKNRSSSSPAMDQHRSSPLSRIGRQRGETNNNATPTPLSSTSGKSSTLLIKNLSDSTTEADIRQFGQAIPGGIVHVVLDNQQAKVTLKNPESAVLFRRRYNRTALKGSHIIISFS